MTQNSLHKFMATSVAVSAIALSLLAPSLPVYAQLASEKGGSVIQPSSQWVNGDSMTRSRFIETMNPGESLTRSVTVSNFGSSEVKIFLDAEDRLPNIPDFTFSDKEDVKEVGSWIKLETKEVLLGSQKAANISFTITVPEGTKAGEYAGAIVMEEAPANEAQKGSGFQLRSRVGTRVYITVPSGDLKYGIKFDAFEFITPGTSTYEDFVKGYYRQDPTRVYMNWKYSNIGNVFTKLKGNLKITGPNGEVTSQFDTDLNTFDQPIIQPGLPTESKWVVGNYKARFEFENPPVHLSNQKRNLPNISPVQFVEADFNMTQDKIDQIKKDFEALKTQRPTPNPAPVNPKQDDSKPSVQAYTETKKEEPANNTLTYVLLAVGGLFILGLIGVILFLVVKMKKDKKEDEKGKVQNSEKTEIQTLSPESKQPEEEKIQEKTPTEEIKVDPEKSEK